MQLDIEAIRTKIHAMDFVRGTPEQVVEWTKGDRDSRHNLVIEDMIPEPDEDALFAMMLEEAVPPLLASQIIERLLEADMLARHLARHNYDASGHTLMQIDVEAVRACVLGMDFVRDNPVQVSVSRMIDDDSRRRLVSMGMLVEPDKDRLFEMFMEEAVPEKLCVTLIADLLARSGGDR